jgi:hypothetical protein
VFIYCSYVEGVATSLYFSSPEGVEAYISCAGKGFGGIEPSASSSSESRLMTCLIPPTSLTSTDGFPVSSSSSEDDLCVSSPVIYPSIIVSATSANFLRPSLSAWVSATYRISSSNSSSESLMNCDQITRIFSSACTTSILKRRLFVRVLSGWRKR